MSFLKYCSNTIPKKKLQPALILTGYIFCGILLIAFISHLQSSPRVFTAETEIQNDFAASHFDLINDWETGKLVVDNRKCKIPDTTSWEPSVQNLVYSSPVWKCRKSGPPNITYVDGNAIRINEALLHQHGDNSSDVNCCYRVLEPAHQPFNDFNYFSYSLKYTPDCLAMGAATKPISGLVKVTCKNGIRGKPFYENFHSVAVLSKENSNFEQKRSFWGKCIRGEIQNREMKFACSKFSISGFPPNILILMLESTSRVNFRRYMHRTVKFLEETLLALEMQGHTKVAENSFPYEMLNKNKNGMKCFADSWTSIDNCSFIADRFSNDNYLIGRYEDDTMKAFTNPGEGPSCMRSLMVSGKLQNGRIPDKPSLIGYKKRQELILENALSLASQAASHEIPYYITVSMGGDVLQEDMETLQLLDDILANFLNQLLSKGLFKNSILFLAGDHGARSGKFRKTAAGWYENRLPVLWIKLPDSTDEPYLAWLEALKYNSKQLTTNFDIGATLLNVQQEFSILKEDDFDLILDFEIQPERGIDLFKQLPERACEDADVTVGFCACEPPVKFTENETLIEQAGKAAVQFINQAIPPSCLKESKHKILYSGRFPGIVEDLLFLQIVTFPGNMEFEAYVKVDAENGTSTEVIQVFRTSKILRKQIACLKRDQCASAIYCVCDPNAEHVGVC